MGGVLAWSLHRHIPAYPAFLPIPFLISVAAWICASNRWLFGLVLCDLLLAVIMIGTLFSLGVLFAPPLGLMISATMIQAFERRGHP